MADPVYTSNGVTYVRQFDPNTETYSYVPLKGASASSFIGPPAPSSNSSSSSISSGVPTFSSESFNTTSNPFAVNPAADAAPSTVVSNAPSIDWSQYQVPSMDTFIAQAQQDPSVLSYYQQLLDQAKGDVTEATSRLDEDYTKGLRREREDNARQVGYSNANIANTLATLGIQFNQESEGALDTLNKRGIAVTDNAAGGPTKNVATEGRAGFEMGQLGDSQKLRQEALTRTDQRNIEQLGINSSRFEQDQPTTYKRNLYDIQRSGQQAKQDITGQQQQAVTQRAGILQGEAANAANAKLQDATWNAQFGSSPGGGGSAPNKSDINPATGKAYAINPSSGVWDDNYFSQSYG